jgi:hypothetical protein
VSLKSDIKKLMEAAKPKKTIRFVYKESDIDQSRDDIIWVLYSV